MRKTLLFSAVLLQQGCFNLEDEFPPVVPAEEFAKSYREGTLNSFSFRTMTDKARAGRPRLKEEDVATLPPALGKAAQATADFSGDTKYLEKGMELTRSFGEPPAIPVSNDGGARAAFASTHAAAAPAGGPPYPPQYPAAQPPPGSSAPYYMGQQTGNPSLWPDEAQGAFLLNDHRAFSAMDIVTIVINDNTIGKKKTDTETKTEFDILAGITEFFGIETRKWAANNDSLNPAALIQASTETEFKGEADVERSGSLKAQLSAVIMEVLPNGLLRVEGSKIVSINGEDEIMVVSGLIRQRDITSENRVDSNRLANMRVDFYGYGLLSETQKPGWGARIFNYVWPF